MLSLVGELARARQEMETNSARIHDLEEALKREKHAREVAEDRAAQLENTSRLARANPSKSHNPEKHRRGTDIPCLDAEDPVATAAKAAVELQQRMGAILEELASVKNDMHSYKLRAEAAEKRAAAAEKERDADKTTLLDTIRQIRAEEISRLARATEASSQTTADDSNADADATETRDFGVQVTTPGDGRRASAPPGIVRADSSSIHTVQGLSEEQTLLLRKQSAAPYASLLGVVVLGVGLMAVINNWQRGDR
jgi:chromosome segregation ATPase